MTRRSIVLVGVAGGVIAALVLAIALFVTDGGVPPGRGDTIAYGCREPKNAWYAICTIRTDGTDAQRITSDLATTEPAWSADGRRVAFTRNQDEGESTLFTLDDVFVMNADGSDVGQVTPDSDGSWSGQPDWSPDGRELVFVKGPKVSSAVQSKYGTLFRTDVDGGVAQKLDESRTDTDPDWSPDGRTIAFIRGEELSSPTDANDDLWILDVTTGSARQLTRTPPGTLEAAPAWSPDGSRIAFARATQSSQFDGTASIHVVKLDEPVRSSSSSTSSSRMRRTAWRGARTVAPSRSRRPPRSDARRSRSSTLRPGRFARSRPARGQGSRLSRRPGSPPRVEPTEATLQLL